MQPPNRPVQKETVSSEPLPSKEDIAANLSVPFFASSLIKAHPEAEAIIKEIEKEQRQSS